MLSGGLVEQTPLLLGFRQIPAYKSIVPLQGFEPCFVPRLSTIKDMSVVAYTNRPTHQRRIRFAALKRNKTWLRIKDEPNS